MYKRQDLGFTYFDLPNGDRAGIIDVQGPARFINNMVAGVVGMDLVMLVIAADEGIMPQTREHLSLIHIWCGDGDSKSGLPESGRQKDYVF